MKAKASVLAHFTFDKRVMPFKIMLEDGTSLKIDRVLDVRPAASLRAGGSGIRYVCDCTRHYEDDEIPVARVKLFRDDDEWYCESI
jgi:hypothetical protein